jgi:hypothetical protein
VVQREFVLRKKIKLGVKMVEFSDGLLIWIPAGTKHVLYADGLFVYERSIRSRRFYTVSRLSLMFWGK